MEVVISMSIKVNLVTNQKTESKRILYAIADLIEKANNERVTIVLEVEFSKPIKKDC